MNQTILLVSGPIAVGKSTVAERLVERYGFQPIRSGPFLREVAEREGKGNSRSDLQRLGDSLDVATDYRWLVDDVAAPLLREHIDTRFWLLDSVRKRQQVAHFRALHSVTIYHVHFTASEELLRKRYEARIASGNEYLGNTPHDLASTHSNEIESRRLVDIADVAINLEEVRVEEAVEAIANRCGVQQ